MLLFYDLLATKIIVFCKTWFKIPVCDIASSRFDQLIIRYMNLSDQFSDVFVSFIPYDWLFIEGI